MFRPCPGFSAVLALSLLAIFAPLPAFAAQSTGSSEAVVVRPLTLVAVRPLSFGNLIAGATPGTATVDEYTEARTVTGGVTQAGGTISAARFTGLTSGNSHLKIDIPNGSITLTHTNGTTTMTADTFELNGDKNDWVGPNEVFEFQVGARLLVGANQLPGTYTGTFDVTVTYR